jgi:hypothetical protein
MKKFLYPLFCLPFLLATAAPARSQLTEIRQFSATDFTQLPTTVYLYRGQGLTISYAKANQTVETVWLDNPRFVGLDSDGCLQGLQPNCAKNEASTLHLKLIDSMPGAKVNQINKSLMTVVTVDAQGQRHNYLYRLQASLKGADGDGTALIEYVLPMSAKPTTISATTIQAGMQLAYREGRLKDPQLMSRTLTLLNLLNSGVPLETAAKEAGVSMTYVRSLAK